MNEIEIVIRARNEASKVLNQFSADLGKTIDTAASQLKQIGAVAGAGLAVGFGSAIVEAAKFEDKLLGVVSKVGPVGASMEELSEVALQFGRDTKFSTLEAAEGLDILAQLGVKTKEDFTNLINASGNLAVALKTDLGSATSLIQTQLNTFNLETSEAARVADLLAAAANNSNLDMQKLTVALQYAGPAAAVTNTSLFETLSIMGALSKNIPQASKVGNTFKQFLITLVKPTAEAQNVLAELSRRLGENVDITKRAGESTKKYNTRIEPVLATLRDRWNPELQGATKIIKDLRDANLTTAEAVAIFGRIHGTNVKLLAQNADEIDRITKSMQDSYTAYEQAQLQLKGLKGQYDLLFGSLKVVQTLIGTEFLKSFANLTNGITQTLNEFTNLGTQLGLFEKTLSPIVTAIENLVNEVIGLNEEADKTSVALKAWEIFGTITSTIAGLIQYIADVIKAAREFNEETGLLTKVTEFYIQIAKDFISIMKDIGLAVLDVSGKLADFFNADTEEQFETLKNLISDVYENIKDFVNDGISKLTDIDFSTPLNAIGSFLTTVAGIATPFVLAAGAIKAFLDIVKLIPGVKLLTEVPLGAATTALKLFGTAITAIAGTLNPFSILAIGVVTAVAAAWESNFLGIKDAVNGFKTTLESTGNIFNAFDSAASIIITRMKEIASSFRSELPEATEDMITGLDKLYQAFKTFTDGVENLFKGNISEAFYNFGDSFGQLYEAAEKIFPALGELISNQLTELQNYIDDFSITGFTDSFGEAGGIIESAFQGFKDTINAGIDVIKAIFEGDFKGAVELIPDVFKAAFDAVGPIFEAAKDIIGNLISEYGPAISEKAKDIVSGLGDLASGVIDSLSGGVSQGLDALSGYLKDFNPDDALSATSFELSGFLGVIISAFGKVIDSLGGFISDNMPKIIEIISQVLAKAEKVWDEFLPVVTKAFSQAVEALANFIAETAPKLIEGASRLIRQAIDFIVKFLTTDMKTELAPGADGLSKALGAIFETAFTEGNKILGDLIAGLGSVIGTFLEDIVETISGDNSFSSLFAEWALKIGVVSTAFSSLFGIGIVSFLGSIISGVASVVGGFITFGKAVLEILPSFKMMSQVFDAVKIALGGAGQTLLSVFGFLKDGALAVASFVKGFFDLSGIANTVVTAFKTFGAALLATNPILLGIAAVTAVYIAWKTNFLGIGEVIDEFLQGAFGWLIEEWEALPDTISKAWASIKSGTTSALTAIGDFIVDTWEAMQLTVMDIIEGLINGITVAWASLKTGIGTAITAISDLIKTAWEGLKNLTISAFNGVKDTITQVLDYAITKVKSFVETITGFFKGVLDYLKNWGTSIYDYVSKAIGKIIDYIGGIGDELYDGAVNAFSSWIDGVKDALSKGTKAVSNALGKIGKLLIGNSPPPEGPLSMIDSGGFNVASAWVDGMASGLNDSQSVIASSLSDMTTLFDSAGTQSALSLEDSLASGLANVQNNISTAANSISKIIDSTIPSDIASNITVSTKTAGATVAGATSGAIGLTTGNNLLTAPIGITGPTAGATGTGDTFIQNIDMGGQVINTPLDYTNLRTTIADDVTRTNRQRYGSRGQSRVVAR